MVIGVGNTEEKKEVVKRNTLQEQCQKITHVFKTMKEMGKKRLSFL